jgi:hypothetical protein
MAAPGRAAGQNIWAEADTAALAVQAEAAARQRHGIPGPDGVCVPLVNRSRNGTGLPRPGQMPSRSQLPYR